MSYSISQVAKRFDIEAHTLRYYEKEGLVAPERTKSGIRSYNEENIKRLEMAMCLKSTGMSIKEIKLYFDLVDLGESTLEQRLEIFNRHRDHVLDEIEVLKMHLTKIENKIAIYLRYIAQHQEEQQKQPQQEAV